MRSETNNQLSRLCDRISSYAQQLPPGYRDETTRLETLVDDLRKENSPDQMHLLILRFDRIVREMKDDDLQIMWDELGDMNGE